MEKKINLTRIKTPITIITGYLGSGKTTLLKKILEQTEKKLAILMNEFGEISIDGEIIKGKNVDMVEMLNGCVCCSLSGEFEQAIKEILEKVRPDAIIVETTGVAEPDAVAFDIQENLSDVRLDGIITIVDCYSMTRFPSLGYTGKVQIEMADILILNKIDLVSKEQLEEVKRKVRKINSDAIIFETINCNVDTNLLFGQEIEKVFEKKEHMHDKYHLEGMESFSFSFEGTLNNEKFEKLVLDLPTEVYRAKGFVNFPEGGYLFNYVNGRYDFENFDSERINLVFIGKNVLKYKEEILKRLEKCKV